MYFPAAEGSETASKVLDLHSVSGAMYIATRRNIHKYTADGVEETQDWANELYFHTCKLFSFDGEVYAAGKANYLDGATRKTGYFWCKVEDIYSTLLNNGGTSSFEEDKTTVPEIVVSRNPNGSGGTMIDGVNMLSTHRRISFLGDSTSTRYNLWPEDDFTSNLYKYVIIDKVEYMNANGKWITSTAYTLPTTQSVTVYNKNGQTATMNVTAPYITFHVAHPPVITGQDNVRITYTAIDMTKGVINDDGTWTKSSSGTPKGLYNENFAAICQSGKIRNYGYQNNDRLFVVGNDNRVYYSAVGDPLNMPDNNYIAVSNTAKIVNIHRFDSYLVAITESTETESSLYFINGTELSSGKQGFALFGTAVTMGAVAPESFATLIDEPLFLTRAGLYGISNHYMSSRLAIRNRSIRVNKALTKEPNLENAVAYENNGYFYVALNNKCYVFDSRQKTKDDRNSTNFSYECYLFDNMPITTFGQLDDVLYFVVQLNGRSYLARFNDDIENNTAYEDNGTETDGVISGGTAIDAYWTSPIDHDGKPQYFKTLNKKGCVAVLKPATRCTVDISIGKDGTDLDYVQQSYVNTAEFFPLYFDKLSFSPYAEVRDIYIRKKVKKYKALQFKFENNYLDEPFGLIQVVKTYTVGNFAK